MGQRGPRKEPSRLQALKGNPSGRRNKGEPKPPTTDQKPPSHLQGVSLSKWVELASVLEPMGLLTDADRDVLSMHCVNYELYMTALKDVQKEGIVMTFHSTKQNRTLSMTHPQAVNLGKLETAMLKTSQHFGLTPATRLDLPRLDVVSPLAAFIGT